MSDDRQMIHFPVGERLFNHRVAGIAVRDGHVLVCTEDTDNFCLLPGGRIELGEDSKTSLEREIEEEMRSLAKVGRLLFAVENFFERDGFAFHEVGIYYELDLPSDFAFVSGDVCLETEEDGHMLYFRWLPIDETALRAANLQPHWLYQRLADLPKTHEHLIIDERG